MHNVERPGQVRWVPVIVILLLVAGGSAGYFYYHRNTQPRFTIPNIPADPPMGDIEAQVHHFCSGCHAYPPPNTFPKEHWPHEVAQGYGFFEQGHMYYSNAGKNLQPPHINDVVKYYVDRAPEEMPAIDAPPASHAPPVRFEPTRIPGPPMPLPYAISNINVVRLFDAKRPDILACDMRNGVVMAYQPYLEKPTWKILGKVSHPAHAEVVDLDGDGIPDILVANLGSFKPTDTRSGSVVWLRGQRDGTFTAIPLLEDVGRVADVQAADFRGTGKLDLVVASFGWNKIGEIIYLENRTADWSKPNFVPRVLDTRHGAIHVPVVDLNRDGKPDFVALIAQEHESIVAFLNDGNGAFRKETIFQGEHPALGSSGIQMVDMNGDGHLDVLYTNGDTLDVPHFLKPYHGVQWLENPGNGKFPWKRHAIAPFYGAHRALAADFCGAGKMDVVAVSFLPPEAFPTRQKLNLDALLLLERAGPDSFARHVVESVKCDSVSCALGDLFATGRNDIVTGAFVNTKAEHVATIWKNLGPAKK
jgi:hypothetical protein